MDQQSSTKGFSILCVTNRSLCDGDFWVRFERIAAAHPGGMILREKELSAEAYKAMAEQALCICKKHRIPCILHSFADVAIELGADAIHLPLPRLRELNEQEKRRFKSIGTSCHSLEEALEAERLGCTYMTVGHIFETDCKKGLPGRGVDLLEKICESVLAPVYAIGGIGKENVMKVKQAGAQGACIMSGFMQCEDVETYLRNMEKECE